MTARGGGELRLVQVSSDFERTGGAEYEPARAQGVAARSDDLADFVGAVCATLHRYTQQETIALDVLSRDVRRAIDVSVAGDAPLGAVITSAKDALGRARPANGSARSNVAVVTGGSPASYDLAFVVGRGGEDAAITYNAKVFKETTVARIRESLRAVIDAAAGSGATHVDELPLLGAAGVRELTSDQDSGTLAYPEEPVHRTFEARARETPDAVAAVHGTTRLTYAELDARANRLAHFLVSEGVGPDVAVGVCFRPSVDVLVALMAIYKARGLHFPLDPTHPEALLAAMLEEASPRVVLTHAALSPLTKPERYPQVCLDTDDERLRDRPSATPPAVTPSLDDAAYLLYTSGTTGRPKGVVATQRNVAHFIHSARERYGFRASDVFTSIARYTFSISLFDLLSPLCVGGSVRMVDREDVLALDRLVRVLEEVTVLHAGPSLLGSLFRHLRTTPAAPRTFPRMRHASSGGDLVPPVIMEEMKSVFPEAELFVIYGCTEIACMGTTFPIPRDRKVTRTFVGKPFPDVTLRVLDAKGAIVPFGVVGEIWFAGKGIARGYLQRPDLTAAKFVEREGRRFYRTGDVGRLHESGDLEILGRTDFQVQLRGIRVELAGIENTVRELELAAQCAVVAKKLDVDDVRLVAFVVQPKDASVAAFRRALSTRLPEYMLPQHVVVLDAMPLTANGKLDRRRLETMPWETTAAGATTVTPEGTAQPQNAVERTIAEVFARVVGRDRVGVDENFFDLGGHSLLAVVAMREIEHALGVTFSPYVLFECATARALASHVGEAGRGEARPILLNERCPGPRVFMLSGVQIYEALAKRLEGRYSAYGVFAPSEFGTLDSSTIIYSVEELARDYLAIVRREQAHGPYYLVGYSFAGIVAYEAAQQLCAQGEEVRFLGLVDAILPEWTRGWRFRLDQLTRIPFVDRRDLVRFVAGRLGGRRWPHEAEFARFADDARVGPLEHQREAVNFRAAADYMRRMRPYEGPVTLAVSGARLRSDPLKSPTGGFGRHVRSLRVERIEADHFRMLSEDPFVSQLAEVLARDIARAASRSVSSGRP